MLTGRSVTLREVRREDLPVIHRELRADVVTASLGSEKPWRPVSLARLQAEFDHALTEPPDEQFVRFGIQERGDPTGTLIGTTALWGIDLHNGLGHIGIQLASSTRGRGFGLDALRVVCHYGFVVRGLYRLGLETLASNEPMRRTAAAAGFTEEGRLRQVAFVLGERVDEILYGLLRSEWQPAEVELTG
jgi:RimJ/RimL family protein N-acetyltransferase